jgi:pimeloyl-ACP methyl ester carboxylesterase
MRDCRQRQQPGIAARDGPRRAAHHLARFVSAAGTSGRPQESKAVKGEKIDAPYLLTDMAADAVGLLDALGIRRAHMVGASMGGMIVQIIAARYPGRTASMVSIMSTSGRRGLPHGRPEALTMLSTPPEGPAREQLIAHPGWGHDFPKATIPQVIDRITHFCEGKP